MLLGEPPAHWTLFLLSKVDILLLLKGRRGGGVGGEKKGEEGEKERGEGWERGREKGKRREYEM